MAAGCRSLVAITVGFGAPRATAVIAVLGYRVVNYWLPLLPGGVAYLRLRLNLKKGRQNEAREPTGWVIRKLAATGRPRRARS